MRTSNSNVGHFSAEEKELCCFAALDSLLPSELPLSTFGVHFYKHICCFCCLPTLIEVFV